MNTKLHDVVDESVIEDLRKRKILVESAKNVELGSVAGLVVLGTLTDPEKSIFIEVVHLGSYNDDWQKELSARSINMLADATRQSDRSQDIFEKLKDQDLFENKAEAEEFFRDSQKYSYLKEYFWYSVRERLQTYATKLTIRAGYKVCRVGYKYNE